MGLFKSLAGIVRLEIVSADIPGFFSQVNRNSIPVFTVSHIDDLTVRLSIYKHDYKVVTQIAEHRGERLKIVKKQGMYWTAKGAISRPLLLVGMAAFLILALYLPSRIFFVRVEGNSAIPTRLIIDKAEDCGICFGASRREVRSEKMKNALLVQIPELQWAGVNTSGCVATISVKEKSIAEESEEETFSISSIVASRDGIIRECTVLQGTALCQVGQAVKAGQTLVSGYTDCGILIKAARAEAEIFAQTLRDVAVLTPTSALSRGDIIKEETKYSLLIGKKLIKFYKDSGISDSSCVKMYVEDYLTLPGGFAFPIALVRETCIQYDTQSSVTTDAESFSWMVSAADDYLQSQMVAGQILNKDSAIQLQDDICYLTGHYACLEMIGQVKNEEILQSDAENN